jgi:hypothetical protein
MVAIGNVLRGGPSTPADLPFMMLGGSGSVEWFAEDNIAVDSIGRPLPMTGRYTTAAADLIPIARPALPEGLRPRPAVEVQDHVVRNSGARPWDRDAIDARIVANVIEGRGEVIDSEAEVGGYPAHAEARQPFDPQQWNLDSMTRR